MVHTAVLKIKLSTELLFLSSLLLLPPIPSHSGCAILVGVGATEGVWFTLQC